MNPAQAQERPAGVTIYGMRGLTTVPSARMDEPGTVRATLSTLDPYAHGMLGVQIAKPLYVSLRQSAEASNLRDDADRLYPGIDIKLRLLEEGVWHPEVSVGWLGATGHKRLAGEYLSLSKRWENFEFTAGIGWGRLGSAGHIGNPLGLLGDHFKKERSLDGEMPNAAEDWFTGDDAGLFAGVEYEAPFLDGLSLIAEWGADRYVAEELATGFDAPAPWSLGARYHPFDGLALGAAIAGGNKVIASLSLQAPVARWPGRGVAKKEHLPMRPYRTGMIVPEAMELAAERNDITLHDTRAHPEIAATDLEIDTALPLPAQLGRASRAMADHAGETIEALDITPTHLGLRGPSIRLIRRDLEQTFARRTGSPEEIWRNTTFNEPLPKDMNLRTESAPAFLRPLSLALETQASLAEEDSGILYRTSMVAGLQTREILGFMSGAALRLNLFDNLDRLDDLRAPSFLPVRSNVDRFAETRIALDRLYVGKMHSFSPALHLNVAGGYMEEMYAGVGGAILYRPFGATWAVGAESFLALKRDPASTLHLMLSGDRVLTGHIMGYYEFPQTDMTLEARIGRYLNEDIGGTLALSRRFAHGLSIRAFATATDQADADLFGGTTYLHAGLEMTLPIGNLPLIPSGSALTFKAAPLGRDTGQYIENPLDLYAMTEPLSYRHTAQYWGSIAD